ncbi:UDP-glucose/GDP-mannose dehydrogenase family protein [Devosia sp.]|uniref:UDP-glucose dehydrogenase family protein n=1 Tax=Devosia sp. TaxID=1871048 RepID=UPI001AC382F5|nr:UDP-glucose/GDP-mannose dehydrogenase family protein [Devosia sp.]MBN9310472.1 UDP-glucose/GDP-mannose dehydrogenase family protein [Devosia sp.]
MKVTVFGSGYVGLVTGACLADAGNQVVCVDVDEDKIALLNDGGMPIYEPGLDAIVAGSREAGRLSFTTDIAQGVDHGEVLFIAVGTPPEENGSADLKYVLSVAHSIGQHLNGFRVIADKSTVPVGTADLVAAAVTEELVTRGFAADPEERIRLGQPDFTVVSNPEFLKEGAAVADFSRPDRIVIGADNTTSGRRGLELMRYLYAPFTLNRDRTMVMDVRSAELTKYAANAMLATRISFMNELANLAEDLGADIELVRRGIGSDPRIGYSFLYAGTGYGGSCFPKDVSALRRSAAEHGRSLRILEAVEEANTAQKEVLGRKIRGRFGDDLSGLTFAVWGLAFKPNTDDMRDAPSRVLIADLIGRGARVRAFDPVAMEEARRVLALDLDGAHDALTFAESANEAVEGADALVIVTEWKAFRAPDFSVLATRLTKKAIFDGRNMYEPSAVEEAGLAYFPIGRRQVD